MVGGNSTFAYNIARWNGTNWNDLGLGIWGQQLQSSRRKKSNEEKRSNGGNIPWFPANQVGGIVLAIAIDTKSNEIYVGGQLSQTGTNISISLIAKWNGSGWFSLGSPSFGFSPLINAMTFDSNGYLYAGVSSLGIFKWNGQNWNLIGNVTGGTINTISYSQYSNCLYVGGTFLINSIFSQIVKFDLNQM